MESISGDKSMYTSIQLGGQRYAPEHFKDNVLQLVDNMYYNTDRINYTFGADFMYTNMKSLYGSEMNGRFYFTDWIISSYDSFTAMPGKSPW